MCVCVCVCVCVFVVKLSVLMSFHKVWQGVFQTILDLTGFFHSYCKAG